MKVTSNFSLVNREVYDLDLDDAELLASLDAQEDVESVQMESVQDSGYRTHSDIFTQSSRGSAVRSVLSAASSRWVEEHFQNIVTQISDRNVTLL